MNTRIVVLIILIALLTGCEYLYTKNVTGRYYLVGENKHDVDLRFKVDNESFVGVVDNSIVEINFNENFIVTKQQDYEGNIHYYIVPIYKEFTYEPEKGVLGPLTFEEFNRKKMELGVSDKIILKKVR